MQAARLQAANCRATLMTPRAEDRPFIKAKAQLRLSLSMSTLLLRVEVSRAACLNTCTSALPSNTAMCSSLSQAPLLTTLHLP